MPRTTIPSPVCTTTKPGTLSLTACRFCAGTGVWPGEDGVSTVCVACEGGTFTCLAGNLGPTRTHPTKGRPFLFNPGTGLMTLTRGTRTEAYTVKELTPSQTPSGPPLRAFEIVRTTGVRAGEVYHLFVGTGFVSCNCAGKTYAATARADARAHSTGGTHYPTRGCGHTDAVALFLTAGLFDISRNR